MQEQLQQILQQQLRDVHLPEQVSWWPLAPGWWILLSISVLVISGLCYWFFQRRAKNQYRKTARLELQNSFDAWQISQNTTQYLQSANNIMKRVVMHLSGAQEYAKLSGKAWATALESFSQTAFSAETEYALSEQLYQAAPIADINLIHQELVTWVQAHRLPKVGAANLSHINEANHA